MWDWMMSYRNSHSSEAAVLRGWEHLELLGTGFRMSPWKTDLPPPLFFKMKTEGLQCFHLPSPLPRFNLFIKKYSQSSRLPIKEEFF